VSAPLGDELRDKTRQQVLASLGGWSGTVITAIPPVVFVIVNAVSGLREAIIAALASGALLALYRVIRRQSLQQAVTGLFSVAVAAAIAARTGQARGFFLLGIAGAIVYAVVFALSLLVRRPLVGVIWEFLDPTELPPDTKWHKVKALQHAYDLATAAALTMFVLRAAVQLSLFKENRTGLLAVTKLVMGYPLYIAVVALAFWVVRRAKRRIAEPPIADAGEMPVSGGADGPTDRGLGLGQRDE
jgi:hypothetical protein